MLENIIALFFIGIPVSMGSLFFAVFIYLKTASMTDAFLEARREVYKVANLKPCQLDDSLWINSKIKSPIISVSKDCGVNRYDGFTRVSFSFLGFESNSEFDLLRNLK